MEQQSSRQIGINRVVIPLTFEGGMVTDISPLYLKNNQYVYAKNLRLIKRGDDLVMENITTPKQVFTLAGMPIWIKVTNEYIFYITGYPLNVLYKVFLDDYTQIKITEAYLGVRGWYASGGQEFFKFNKSEFVRKNDFDEKLFILNEDDQLLVIDVAPDEDNGAAKDPKLQSSYTKYLDGQGNYLSKIEYYRNVGYLREYVEPIVSLINGGKLKKVAVSYAYRYETKDGKLTNWVGPTTPIPLFHKNGYNNRGEEGYAVKLQIDTDATYKKVEVIGLYYREPDISPEVKVIGRYDAGGTILVTDTGDYYMGSLSPEEVSIDKVPIKARAIGYDGERIFLGNIEYEYYDVDIDYSANAYDSAGNVLIPDTYLRAYETSRAFEMFVQGTQVYGLSGENAVVRLKKRGVNNIDVNKIPSGDNVEIAWTFRRGEYYNVGVVFINEYGQKSFVKHIGTIRVPDSFTLDPYNYIVYSPSFYYPYKDNDGLVTISLEVELLSVPSDAIGWYVVIQEHTEGTRSIGSDVLLSPFYEFTDTDGSKKARPGFFFGYSEDEGTDEIIYKPGRSLLSYDPVTGEGVGEAIIPDEIVGAYYSGKARYKGIEFYDPHGVKTLVNGGDDLVWDDGVVAQSFERSLGYVNYTDFGVQGIYGRDVLFWNVSILERGKYGYGRYPGRFYGASAWEDKDIALVTGLVFTGSSFNDWLFDLEQVYTHIMDANVDPSQITDINILSNTDDQGITKLEKSSIMKFGIGAGEFPIDIGCKSTYAYYDSTTASWKGVSSCCRQYVRLTFYTPSLLYRREERGFPYIRASKIRSGTGKVEVLGDSVVTRFFYIRTVVGNAKPDNFYDYKTVQGITTVYSFLVETNKFVGYFTEGALPLYTEDRTPAAILVGQENNYFSYKDSSGNQRSYDLSDAYVQKSRYYLAKNSVYKHFENIGFSQRRYPFRFIWSQKVQELSFGNGAMQFAPNDFAEVNSDYGEVTHIAFVLRFMYVLQERGVAFVLKDERALMQTDGSTVVIGSGALIGQITYERGTREFGADVNDIPLITEFGLYFYDRRKHELCRLSEKFERVSYRAGVRKYLEDRFRHSLSVVLTKHPIYDEIYIHDGYSSSGGFIFSEILDVFVGEREFMGSLFCEGNNYAYFYFIGEMIYVEDGTTVDNYNPDFLLDCQIELVAKEQGGPSIEYNNLNFVVDVYDWQFQHVFYGVFDEVYSYTIDNQNGYFLVPKQPNMVMDTSGRNLDIGTSGVGNVRRRQNRWYCVVPRYYNGDARKWERFVSQYLVIGFKWRQKADERKIKIYPIFVEGYVKRM